MVEQASITRGMPQATASGSGSKQKRARQCFWVPEDAYVEGEGFRVSLVTEGQPGHQPTGVWPYDVHAPRPYFWGHDLAEAQATAYRQNERMGHSREDTDAIVASSFVAQMKSNKRRR